MSERIEFGLSILFLATLALATFLVWQGSRRDLDAKRSAVRKELGESLELTNKGLQFLLDPNVIPSLIRSRDAGRAEKVIWRFIGEGAELSAVVVTTKDLKPFAVVSPQQAFKSEQELQRFVSRQANGIAEFSLQPAIGDAPGSLVIRHPIVESGRVDGFLFAEVDLKRVLRRISAAHAYPLSVRLAGLAVEQGHPSPILDASIRPEDVFLDVARYRLGIVLLILFAIAVLYVLCRLLVRKMIFPFELLVVKLDAAIKGDRAPIDEREYPAWFQPFVGSLNSLIASVIKTQEQERRAMASQALQETASQVAHDIRSPLAALDSLAGTLSHLPEDKRVLLRGAVGRIKDIANNLAQRTHRGDPDDALTDQLLSSLIEPLITEKRMQFRSRAGLELDARLDASSYGLFAKVQSSELKRMISNLINNAVEALGERGRVLVSVSPQGDGRVSIRVEDDGKGIPADILPLLGRRGETHGKAGGAGLGLSHARMRAESWGGSLSIASELGKGTAVTISLPRAPAPAWFVSRLDLSPRSEVVILDDDSSIHRIWKGRFESLRLENEGITLRHFSTPAELRRWAQGHAEAAARAVFLVDYELLGCEETGLGLVRSLGFGARSILVTSRYEESSILRECVELGVRLIPKGLAGFVPISGARPALDCVLVDDDELIRLTWTTSARDNGKTLEAFSSPEGFFLRADAIDRGTPVYVDVHLGGGVRGDEVAKRAAEMGFRNVFLATGSEPADYRHLEFLKGVIGKTPPWQS
ncbi:MAG: hypothetical protein A2506_08700 [Elusimicrobia bacterium RIFOXYD12_FULL_66_9]|nr:MAG: hypothetical protein A2506_08700 [Elusimicrobia bacterium RIFOXYD12_FULL_66_9]